MKMPYDFFVYICDYRSTNSWFGKNYCSMEWPAHQDERLDGPNISVSATVTKYTHINCFVNKQLTYFTIIFTPRFLTTVSIIWVKRTFSESFIKIRSGVFEKIEYKCQLFVYKKCPRNKKFLFLIRFWQNFVRLQYSCLLQSHKVSSQPL